MLSEFTDEQTYDRDYFEKHAKGVRLEVTEKTDSITGPPDQIFEQLDRRTVQSVRVFAELGSSDEKLEVTFRKISRKISYFKAVEIRIKSLNPGWAKQCLAQLSEELDKSVPKWAWFRSGAGITTSIITVYIVAVSMAILIVDRHSPGNLVPFIAPAITLGIWFVVPIAMIWPWIFPSFELYGQGGSSTGGRRLAAIITFERYSKPAHWDASPARRNILGNFATRGMR